MKLISILLCYAFVTLSIEATEYTKSYNPAPDDDISSSGIMGEFTSIGTVLNGNLDSDNVKDNTLQNVDFLSSTIQSNKIKDGTITASDMANINSITNGGMIYATASATLGVLPIGTADQLLRVSSGGIPIWGDATGSGWSYSSGTLYPDNTTDNLVVGGSSAGTSSQGVIALVNGTAPTASITDGVQLYSKDDTGDVDSDGNTGAELWIRDEAGNTTVLSPHNFSLLPKTKTDKYKADKVLNWSYYSERDGQAINVDMYGAVKEIERLSGKKFIYTKEKE